MQFCRRVVITATVKASFYLQCSVSPLVLQALMAGGTYSGELVIWDLNKQDADAQVSQAAAAHARGSGCIHKQVNIAPV